MITMSLLKNFKEKFESAGGAMHDCGVPFCHHGCPLGNSFLNSMMQFYRKIEEAYDILFH